MSTPTVSLDVLRTIHRIHKQLTDLKDRRDRGPRQVRAGEANIKQREQDAEKLREELKTMRKNIDQKQLLMKSNEQKLKELDTKLNQAASNREYQILKDQIAADKMANSVLEDEIIELMEQTDAFQPKIAEADGLLKTTREKVVAARQAVEAQAASIQADIVRLEAELKQCEAGLPAEIRETYLRLVEKKGEEALAEVVDGACGGCCQQVPVNVQANIRMQQPSFCRTCGRLLYVAEEASIR
jgi:predicted  nucleic acid-binding Zn-ribbon protein